MVLNKIIQTLLDQRLRLVKEHNQLIIMINRKKGKFHTKLKIRIVIIAIQA